MHPRATYLPSDAACPSEPLLVLLWASVLYEQGYLEEGGVSPSIQHVAILSNAREPLLA